MATDADAEFSALVRRKRADLLQPMSTPGLDEIQPISLIPLRKEFAKLVFVSKTSAEMTPDGEQQLRRPRHIAAVAQYRHGRISSKDGAYHDKSVR